MAIAAKKRQAITQGQLDALKALAMLCMLADHANWLVIAESSPLFRYAGRLALPLFVALLAYNIVHHAQKPWRYVGRLLAAVISQPVYDMVFAGAPWQLNVLWTLTIGAAFMAGVKTARRF